MLKPPRPHSLMIAIGLPSHGEADEDGLDRERDDGDGSDIAEEAIASIVQHLQHGKAGAVRTLRAFTAALEDMCDAFMAKDYHTVGDAADVAREALRDLISE